MTRQEFFYQCMDVIEHWLNGNRKLSDLREVTDKLYNEVTRPHWISVEDELPPRRSEYDDLSNNVLATDGKKIYKSVYDYGFEEWFTRDVWPLHNITHWMSMPQAPKGEQI